MASLYKPDVEREVKAKKKTINVSSSSTFGLSNELALLQAQFMRDREAGGNVKQAGSVAKSSRGTKAAWQAQKQNKGVSQRQERDLVQYAREMKESTTVREALERKAKLYDKIKRGELGEVQLGDTALDVDLMSVHSSDRGSDEDESEEDLVEFTDEFGRTRMVPKMLVSELEKEDGRTKPQNLIYGDVIQHNAFKGDEEAMQAIINRDDTKDLFTHYDANGEVRTKGVGFYNFSKDEEKRAKEMDELRNMREETKKMKSRSQEVRLKWLNRRQARRDLILKAKAEKDATTWLETFRTEHVT
ncbi:hypothetical protein V1512DRAFT_200448 [Lipomyces arxii]|uniref:uncharacterized protein n=1 Tax=Lipomyces arxii TaxID=56418 RepID=UPI0034CFB5BC